MKLLTLLASVSIFLYANAQENTPSLCSDGIDNDGDGLIDCNDNECSQLSDDDCNLCKEGITFADEVIEYVPTCPDKISEIYRDPSFALGLNDDESVTLGEGGFIKLKFTNNRLTNSGNNLQDVYIFEIGPAVESSNIALKPADLFTKTQLENSDIINSNNSGYYEFGMIEGATRGLDIDAILSGYAQGELVFDAIQITDVETGRCGTGSPGADIDAVCALSSFATLSTSNYLFEKQIGLQPNPTSGKIYLDFAKLNQPFLDYEIFSVNGKNVFKGNVKNNSEIDLSSFPNGVYFLRLNADNKFALKKVVKL